MFSSYQKQALTVMISPLCTNCHDVTVILLNVALNTINLIFYLQRHIPTYLYIYIFMRIIDFIQFYYSKKKTRENYVTSGHVTDVTSGHETDATFGHVTDVTSG